MYKYKAIYKIQNNRLLITARPPAICHAKSIYISQTPLGYQRENKRKDKSTKP